MKQSIAFQPVFSASARTLDFSGLPNFSLARLIAVINVTRNQIIYAVGSPTYGLQSVSGNVITLAFNTSTQADVDQLQVIYDVGTTGLVRNTEEAMPVVARTSNKLNVSFVRAITGGVDSEFFTLVRTGTGMTVNQTGGNLVIASGTTANSETIIRSNRSFGPEFLFQASAILSQRIANQTFFIELVDVITDNAALTVNSATSITITIPNSPFTSQNVGQSMYVGNVVGVTGAVSGRYTIASVAGNAVTFTVAGWPVSGSGTASLWGWNYHLVSFSGTTATSATYDVQNRGYSQGAASTTINTTASPGTILHLTQDNGVASIMDALNSSFTYALRTTRITNVPIDYNNLRIQIRAVNGATAPASTTTFTVGLVRMEEIVAQPVSLSTARPFPDYYPIPIKAASTLSTSVASLPALVAGTNAIGDVGTQYRANATGAASIAKVLSAASTNATVVKASAGRVIGFSLSNTTATNKFFKFHNTTTAPTVGTTPVYHTVAIPPNNSVAFSAEGGIAHATGITYSITNGAADSDTAAVAANDVIGVILFA